MSDAILAAPVCLVRGAVQVAVCGGRQKALSRTRKTRNQTRNRRTSMSTDLVEQTDDVIEDIVDTSVLATITRAEIDTQISTAKQYPRSITAFIHQATELATLDDSTASEMYYTVPRGGKKITGPSARMAEVVGCCWGNLRYGARVVAVEEKAVIAQGVCFDLEKNVAAGIEVRRRITDSKGARYSEDMISVTAMAACSIALRNAIFKVVPQAIWKPVYEAARQTSLGKGKTMAEKRAACLQHFSALGVSDKDVLAMAERKGVEDLSVDDLMDLRGIATAIKNKEITLAEVLRSHGDRKQVTRSSLNDEATPVNAALMAQSLTTTAKEWM